MPRSIKKILMAFVIAAIAILGFSNTSFADDGGSSNNWSAVQRCESGGSGGWSANTGNGYYGGLQFDPDTWAEYGGTGNPANASRAEQEAVADRVLAGQGIGAWPNCGKYLNSDDGSSTSSDTGQSQNTPQQQDTNNGQHQQSDQSQQQDNNVPQQHHQYEHKHSYGSHDCGNTYTIQSGDTLSQIALDHGTTVQHLANQNNIANVDVIIAGQVLQL